MTLPTPGFIGSHIHIESMVVPSRFARVTVTHGTIGMIADPHEIGNVLGIEVIDYMIRSGNEAQLNFCFGTPNCVPAVGGEIENSGAVISAEDIERMMQHENIGFLGEMMNWCAR